jgi:glycosyltransferase involved in cell wall biosynthesis
MSISKASVIIPMHTASRYIAQTLESLLEQSFPVTEIIVVDDGSTDDSANIVKAIAGDGPIRLIQQPASGGPSAPRNRGLREATGDVLFLFDADDLAERNKIGATMHALDNTAQDVLFAASDFKVLNFRDNEGDRPSFLSTFNSLQAALPDLGKKHIVCLDATTAYDRLLFGNFVGTSSVAIRKQALAQVGYFDEELRYSEDYDYWLRLAKRGGMVVIGDILHRYRDHGEGLSKRSQRFLGPFKIRVLEQQAKNELTTDQRKRVSRQIAKNYFSMGWEAKRDREFDEAVGFLKKSLRAHPQLLTIKTLTAAWLLRATSR